ncbi:MAG: zf-HC2 domain-containing protein [Propionibacteriaceae bacterium]|jgi:anti-sigma factor (TIGR02949 family)|nr:zf-HC2 domain-containing protein [Propionibacteriaceae bacterium]
MELPAICQFTADRINALLDQELPVAIADQVRQHLAACEHCSTEADIWQEIRQAVRHAYAPAAVPAGLTERINHEFGRIS